MERARLRADQSEPANRNTIIHIGEAIIAAHRYRSQTSLGSGQPLTRAQDSL